MIIHIELKKTNQLYFIWCFFLLFLAQLLESLNLCVWLPACFYGTVLFVLPSLYNKLTGQAGEAPVVTCPEGWAQPSTSGPCGSWARTRSNATVLSSAP